MRYLMILVMILLHFYPMWCQEEQQYSIDISGEIVLPRQYIVHRCPDEILIDGKANDNCWKNAPFTESFIDIEGVKEPKFDTRLKMVWDSSFLYVYAWMQEPHVWGDITTRDAVIFYNNDFEVFLSPSKGTRNYGEIEINALGTVWDLSLDRPYRDKGIPNNHWDLDNLKSAIHIEGTLNDGSDIDSCWSVEMAIPLNALMELKRSREKVPREGEQWRANFSRVQWDHDLIDGTYDRIKNIDGSYAREYNWVWSNQNVINMHEPEKWGTIQFTHSVSGEGIKFKKEKNRIFEQIAFSAFRETKKGQLMHLMSDPSGTMRKIHFDYGAKHGIEGIFYKTNFGFEYLFPIPNSNVVFLINEAGEFKIVK